MESTYGPGKAGLVTGPCQRRQVCVQLWNWMGTGEIDSGGCEEEPRAARTAGSGCRTAPGPGPLPQICNHCQASVWASVLSHASTLCIDHLVLWFGCPYPFKIHMLKKILTPRGLPAMAHTLCTAQGRPAEGWNCSPYSAFRAVCPGEKDPLLCSRAWVCPEGTSFLVPPKPWHGLAAPQCLRLSTQPRFTGLHHSLEFPPHWASSWPPCHLRPGPPVGLGAPERNALVTKQAHPASVA